MLDRRELIWTAAILASVLGVSILHYVTNGHAVELHEVFRRLYYLPIVVAAVRFGAAGGTATGLLASVLYLPHVWWGSASPEQYGELVLFNLVGVVTGFLAGRLRRERDRHERAARALERMVADARACADERLRLDRWATVGRLASGLAHEVRNPLGGLQGCLEILEQDFGPTHPKREFFDIARREVARVNALTTSFLDYAQPAAPLPRRIDLRQVAERAAETAGSGGVPIEVSPQVGPPMYVQADVEQVGRALVDIMREITAGHDERHVVLALERAGSCAVARLEVSPFDLAPAGRPSLFEPFSLCGCGHPLSLATARRLVENQGGAIRTEFASGTLRCLVSFPLIDSAAPAPAADLPARTELILPVEQPAS